MDKINRKKEYLYKLRRILDDIGIDENEYIQLAIDIIRLNSLIKEGELSPPSNLKITIGRSDNEGYTILLGEGSSEILQLGLSEKSRISRENKDA